MHNTRVQLEQNEQKNVFYETLHFTPHGESFKYRIF